MNKTTEYFEKNGYVVIDNALNKDVCTTLVEHMFNLFKDGKLVKDNQCPLSDSVYGDVIFDKLLQEFAIPIGNTVSRQLIPTYTYARIYRNGEVLTKHKDRPACEISATLTLGFNSKTAWPIFFDEEKEIAVSMNPGEMVIYKGCDVVHWRPEFKGEWHVQVFLHYVDANGPYKNEKFDGRSNLGANKQIAPSTDDSNKSSLTIQNPIFNSIVIPSKHSFIPGYYYIGNDNLSELKFTNDECDRIISLLNDRYPVSASIGAGGHNSKITRSVRSANIFNIENNSANKWIFEKIANVISVTNAIHFDYDISGIVHDVQLIEYSANFETAGHYDWHVDAGNGVAATRKISFTAQMTHPSEYEGCELLVNNHAEQITGSKERGSIHLFPSYMLHKVTPITKGTRYALVIWIHGPKPFK